MVPPQQHCPLATFNALDACSFPLEKVTGIDTTWVISGASAIDLWHMSGRTDTFTIPAANNLGRALTVVFWIFL